MNENRHADLSDEESEDEEEGSEDELGEWEWSNAKQKDAKAVKLDEMKEKEKELEDYDLSMDEYVCNNLCNVCLHNLINEERKITQDAIRENAKKWKGNFLTGNFAKEKMEIDEQMEECLCINVCSIYVHNLHREESKMIKKIGIKNEEEWKCKFNKERNDRNYGEAMCLDLHCENKKTH